MAQITIKGGNIPVNGGPRIVFLVTVKDAAGISTHTLNSTEVKDTLVEHAQEATRLEFDYVTPTGWKELITEVLGYKMPKLKTLIFRGAMPAEKPVTVDMGLESLRSLRFMSEEEQDLAWAEKIIAAAVVNGKDLDIHLTPLSESSGPIAVKDSEPRQRVILHTRTACKLRSDDAPRAILSRTPTVVLEKPRGVHRILNVFAFDHASAPLRIDSEFCELMVAAVSGQIHELVVDVKSIQSPGSDGSTVNIVKASASSGKAPESIVIHVPDEETGRTLRHPSYTLPEQGKNLKKVTVHAPRGCAYNAWWILANTKAKMLYSEQPPSDVFANLDAGVEPMDVDVAAVGAGGDGAVVVMDDGDDAKVMDVCRDDAVVNMGEDDEDEDAATARSGGGRDRRPRVGRARMMIHPKAESHAPLPSVHGWSDDDEGDGEAAPHVERTWGNRSDTATPLQRPRLRMRTSAGGSDGLLRRRPPPSAGSQVFALPPSAFPVGQSQAAPVAAPASVAAPRPPASSTASSTGSRPVVSASGVAAFVGPAGSNGSTETARQQLTRAQRAALVAKVRAKQRQQGTL
jgi:hypothetical protein